LLLIRFPNFVYIKIKKRFTTKARRTRRRARASLLRRALDPVISSNAEDAATNPQSYLLFFVSFVTSWWIF